MCDEEKVNRLETVGYICFSDTLDRQGGDGWLRPGGAEVVDPGKAQLLLDGSCARQTAGGSTWQVESTRD